VLDLLEYYGIPDPVKDMSYGEFRDSVFIDLYDSLTAQSNLSIKDALYVGALIEDLDIYDLGVFIDRCDITRILDVFEKLQCASKNHIRSYTKQLEKEGGSYSAQYISNAAYEEILAQENAHCGN